VEFRKKLKDNFVNSGIYKLKIEMDSVRAAILDDVFRHRVEKGEWPLDEVFEIDHQANRDDIRRLKAYPLQCLDVRQDREQKFRLKILPNALGFIQSWKAQRILWEAVVAEFKKKYVAMRDEQKEISIEEVRKVIGAGQFHKNIADLIVEYFSDVGLFRRYSFDASGKISSFVISNYILDENLITERFTRVQLTPQKLKRSSLSNLLLNRWVYGVGTAVIAGFIIESCTGGKPKVSQSEIENLNQGIISKGNVSIVAQNVQFGGQANVISANENKKNSRSISNANILPGKRNAIVQSDKIKRKEIRITLTDFVRRGEELEAGYRMGHFLHDAEFGKKHSNWNRECYEYLKEKLDISYAERFRRLEFPQLNSDYYKSHDSSVMGEGEFNFIRLQLTYLRQIISKYDE
jgi:hypothetical protein